MPTLLDINGFKFFFYANEHDPKHVHVLKGDDYAKIELLTDRIVENSLKPKDLKYALTMVAKHRNEFERTWDEWFN